MADGWGIKVYSLALMQGLHLAIVGAPLHMAMVYALACVILGLVTLPMILPSMPRAAPWSYPTESTRQLGHTHERLDNRAP